MTSQAIEGTGMTLRMYGGWTSDIVEMQLPYVVRQAIDDTHLGDTIIRWIPSKDIEYGTMAIRFWHDPDNILPITGQPETMVITYPDGVNHLAVIGYVEKIGKESIKVGELMQTDAMVRILHYPKMPSVSNGSFPLFTSSITSKVVTDIIDTATIRYFIESTPSSPTNVDEIIKTIGNPSNQIRDLGTGHCRWGSVNVFNSKPAFAMPTDSTIRYRTNPFGDYEPTIGVTDFTSVFVYSHGDNANVFGTFLLHYFGLTADTSGNPGWHTISYPLGIYIEHNSGRGATSHLYVNGIDTFDFGKVTTKTDMLVVIRRKSGSITGWKNNTSLTPVSYSTKTYVNRCVSDWPRYGTTHPNSSRDFAFWDYALSDTDFEALNDQLCAEYGIT